MNVAREAHLPVRLHIGLHSLLFVFGLSTVFVALGFSAGLVSDLLFRFGDALRIGAGVVLTFFGLLTLGFVPLTFLQRDLRAHFSVKPPGYLGSLLVGVAFGAGWTPCVGPILGGILLVASTSGSALQGGLLLGAYSLGFAVPFIIAAQALPNIRKLTRYTGLIEKVGGVLLVLVGVLLLTNSVAALSPYLASLGSLETSLAGGRPGFGLAFVAGSLSFLSPCVLPILPSFLAYLTGLGAGSLSPARADAA